MKTVVFDIETDGLLPELTTIHSLVIFQKEGMHLYSCTDNNPSYMTIKEGLKILEEADLVIGHNIIKFDLAAIEKLYPNFKLKGRVFDTYLAGQLLYPDIGNMDLLNPRVPKNLSGRYNLKAWGYRFGILKGTYGEQEEAWARWSKEMQDYCTQDVRVTCTLYGRLSGHKNLNLNTLELEQDFAKIISKQEQRGVLFDKAKAVTLAADLLKQQQVLKERLQEVFPPEIKEEIFIPKVNNKTRGYVKGEPFIKKITTEFNPGSRQMIAKRLIEKYNWKPKIYTDKGAPKIDEGVLSGLDFPECPLLLQYITISKLLGMITEGNNAWLKKLDNDGAIHGKVNTLGAVTRRCTHVKPNLAQIPAVEKDKEGNILRGLKGGYGWECRELFKARKGFKLVGCDASGLELRNLAHYLNSPEYTKEILSGDIHTKNQRLAGLDTRAQAKKFIYAFNYGAGDEKIGKMVGVTNDEITQYQKDKRVKKVKKRLQKEGKLITKKLIAENLKGADVKAKFLKELPEMKALIDKVKEVIKKRGFLYGLDRGILAVRKQYKGLNVLLQSAGAVVMKRALIILYNQCVQKGWVKDGYYLSSDDKIYWVLNVHDEYQAEVKPEILNEYVKMAPEAITLAGEFFKYRCPLAGEAKIGDNWAETH